MYLIGGFILTNTGDTARAVPESWNGYPNEAATKEDKFCKCVNPAICMRIPLFIMGQEMVHS